MLAMPLATVRSRVLANSQADDVKTSRPIASGIHNAPYPHASTRLANAAASAAEQPSSPAQTPSFFIVIASPSRVTAFRSNLRAAIHPRLPTRHDFAERYQSIPVLFPLKGYLSDFPFIPSSHYS